MQSVKVWHNPRCTKSREALAIIEENNYESEVVKYLESPVDFDELSSIISTLGIQPRELMRTTEAIYKELALKEQTDDKKLILAMVENPKLIQRPIIFKGDKAIIGRPASIIKEFLNS